LCGRCFALTGQEWTNIDGMPAVGALTPSIR
jgi:hypothetical protein